MHRNEEPDVRRDAASGSSRPESHQRKRARWRKLVLPPLQLRLTAWFVGVSFVAVTLQFVLVFSRLSSLAVDFPGDPAGTFDALAAAYVQIAVVSLAVALPLAVAVGVLATFRIAGPIVHFTRFLEAVRRGERPADCAVRRGDELQDLCRLLNEVTAPLRGPGADPDGVAAALPGAPRSAGREREEPPVGSPRTGPGGADLSS